ncbi:hypothetical protein IFO70_18295 [Phormidium tenue FACHB-886]|nr:hypothetical protein [Phormidium tenue FACHB-886]
METSTWSQTNSDSVRFYIHHFDSTQGSYRRIERLEPHHWFYNVLEITAFSRNLEQHVGAFSKVIAGFLEQWNLILG